MITSTMVHQLIIFGDVKIMIIHQYNWVNKWAKKKLNKFWKQVASLLACQ